MQAVLYVSHGSRVEKARKEAVSLIQSVRERINLPLQETCFLELAEPNMAQGIEILVRRGATRIAIIPVLLLSAGHYYTDIPEEINRAKLRHPNIHFVYGRTIGIQDRVIDILVQRVQETKVLRHSDANILLVGRGSRHPETKESMEQIAHKLRSKMDVAHVNVSYLAACSPSFDEGLQTSLNEGWSQTFVIPYLWFTGLLMRSMQDKINEVQEENQQVVVLCQYLGNHPIMIDALTDRVHEALQKSKAS
ncbi:sirohydrochlorin chelatase [Halobacillus shinanisalinarum]|uniref:Sirohydrochlorin chelatase n=1 Tax=Halobacillus shinanisalinarum TaxID=2932258 RepID=A0ABY4GYP5_9BACI|nr:sirohydrochlorin chelatase [Halobacillus shinanisalinarum]UOQ93136.1 sirohydrochlorin chelatase [Halobacillus shinanisalinarum]